MGVADDAGERICGVSSEGERVSRGPRSRPCGSLRAGLWGTSGVRQERCVLRQCEVEVIDGFVDFLAVLEADGDGVHVGLLESEAHGLDAIVVLGE